MENNQAWNEGVCIRVQSLSFNGCRLSKNSILLERTESLPWYNEGLYPLKFPTHVPEDHRISENASVTTQLGKERGNKQDIGAGRALCLFLLLQYIKIMRKFWCYVFYIWGCQMSFNRRMGRSLKWCCKPLD